MSRKPHAIHSARSETHSGSGADDERHRPAAHAFLVRLWRETRERSTERPLWRGTLSDLQGHHVGSFGNVVELGELLARATGAAELLLRRGDDAAPH